MGRLAWVIACALFTAAAHADDPDGCQATPENARYQLDKASGNGALALKDWLHDCPNDDLMMKSAQEIEKAKGAPAAKTAAPVPVPSPPPAPKSKKQPYGTFAQSSRTSYDDHSGYYDRDDTLTIREDGTAELRSRYKVNLDSEWHLKGCEDNVRQGVRILTWKMKATVTERTVTLRLDGTPQRTREPSCWAYAESEDDPDHVWVLNWIDGRLKDDSGEYFRQD